MTAMLISVLACCAATIICMFTGIATGNEYIGMATLWFLGAALIGLLCMIATNVIGQMSR